MNHLKYGFSTNVGNVRSHNEDYFRAEPELGLWVVADGMGGHKGGETASTIAADFIVDKTNAGEPLEKSIAQAHHAIKQASKEGKGPEGMGTTVVALRINDNNYEIAWVGDCRAYLWDGITLKQLTKDHSYVQHLVDTGVISPNESANHPYQDVLIQALGAADIKNVNVETIIHEFHQNEQILLCSDGLTKEIADKGIADALALELEEQGKVNFLIQAALKNGGKDNITAILVSADDDAPVRMPEGDTVPINTEELMPNGFLEKLRSWLKRTLKVFLKTK
ncbi:MAG: serine/threonine-protein phosphatase [Desulfobacteraceae bacterium]|nr:serine/threonine-protein phosphatase [Desulfobacteraceae bacterium]MBC2756560.1 serine/threonine-protein phosphatase [Desulfobacteraceae bacterium]